MRKSLNSKGDTIVEVLIAVAIVSSVLGITYSIMNRNLLSMRDNQERTEASKIAQNQIELLRSAWSRYPGISVGGVQVYDSDNLLNVSSNPNFCLVPDTDPTNVLGVDPIANLVNGSDITYGTECTVNSIYQISNHYDSNLNNYLISVRWDGLNNVRNEVVMGYKLL